MSNTELNQGPGFFRTVDSETQKAAACQGLNGLMRLEPCNNMVLRLLEYSIYNTSIPNIQVKIELNEKGNWAIFDRVKFSIILNSVSVSDSQISGVRKNPSRNLTRLDLERPNIILQTKLTISLDSTNSNLLSHQFDASEVLTLHE